ncbi:MAG: hypothetical protein RMJ43_07995 [Chloroherpetonaceae bacterium]|nr:hypothetical protein [Chthonomonadaceae bacterium]MDW8207763.1 hypothetical protein [Chloroherpetonaceae bacterium]
MISYRINAPERSAFWTGGLLLAVGTTVVAGYAVRHLRGEADSSSPVQLTPAAFRVQEPSAATPLPVRVEVNALHRQPASRDVIHALFADGAVAMPPSRTLAPGTPHAEEEPDWFLWARMDGKQLPVRVVSRSSPPAGEVRACATYVPEGVAVLLANPGPYPLTLEVRVRLPRGVFRIERLTFPSEPAPGAVLQPVRQDAREPAVHPAARLERLQGKDLSTSAEVVKPAYLEPGGVCLLRYTDQVQEVAHAWRETHQHLHALARTNPAAARRIRRMLQEGRLNTASLYSGPARRASRRLSALHRMLLATAQAQSVQANLLARNAIPNTTGIPLMGSLERLADALSETSAVLLGLVPRIAILPETAGLMVLAHRQDPMQTTTVRVQVSLTNAGSKTVRTIRIGVDPGALPPGITCEPHDPVFFEMLSPGQTARAIFRMTGPGVASCPQNRYVGDITYRIPDAPAHLRLRAW